ncbi:MAG: family 10 glycosylhydrolase [Clostridiales bacterium]|nr:family 10 glycosylhydrolase [Clostridiales bacterium]
MDMLKRYIPWLILAVTALAAALSIWLYAVSVGVSARGGGIVALPEDLTPPPLAAFSEIGEEQPVTAEVVLPEEMRGVWIATVLNIDFPKEKGDAQAQKQELTAILDTALDAGLNTVFFQVRPAGDALYPSQIFPWSEYLTGSTGSDPGYDPLGFMLEEAHSRGLALHAWINPYRLTMGSQDKPQNTIACLAEGSPVKYRPELTLSAGDGRLYLNPGEPEAVSIVLVGIREILENYAVDGIHLDDYFYPPDPNYDDSAAYAKYAQPSDLPLADWRRENTQTLICKIQALVRETRPGTAFGVSPSGIWRNNKNSPLGSDTNGFESYSQIYADTRQWVKDGLVDYIAPQLYWAIGKEGSDYAHLARWWQEVCRDTDVRLYIGHGAYRLGGSAEAAWTTAEEIEKQLALNKELGINGSIFYGYRQISENTLGLRDTLQNLYIPPEPNDF